MGGVPNLTRTFLETSTNGSCHESGIIDDLSRYLNKRYFVKTLEYDSEFEEKISSSYQKIVPSFELNNSNKRGTHGLRTSIWIHSDLIEMFP